VEGKGEVLASEVKEEVQELTSEVTEAVSGVVQGIVLALCAGLSVIALGALLLVVAII
jgi:hypothetical protein